MVEDDPHIISRLREFLSLINTPVQHAKAAKNVLQVIELRVCNRNQCRSCTWN